MKKINKIIIILTTVVISLLIVLSIVIIRKNKKENLLPDSISSITGYRAIYKVLPITNILPIPILVTPAGAFLIFGILAGIINYVRGLKHESN